MRRFPPYPWYYGLGRALLLPVAIFAVVMVIHLV